MRLNKQYKEIIYSCILLFIFIVGVFLVKNYFRPFFIVMIIYFLCSPIYNFLSIYTKLKRNLKSLISIAFINVLLILLIGVIGNFTFKCILIFKTNYSSFVNELNFIFYNINEYLKSYNINLGIKVSSLLNKEMITRGALSTGELIFDYFIGNIIVYFILIDKYAIFKHIEKKISLNEINRLKGKIDKIKGIIFIECRLVFITMIETILGFNILGINNYIILGVLCGILDFLPYVGTIIIFFPLIFYKVIIKDYIIAIGLIILYILLVINRNIMEMKFISSKLDIPSLPILISLYIGFKMFGVLGLFIGPIYIILLKEFILT